MKEKIAFPQLVELVATKANTTSRMSELFLQELFGTISQALNSGETVKIKGLGTFKIKKEEGGKDILFTPDKDLAEAVNAPFAQFQPVELSDSITSEQLAEIDASMEPSDEPLPQAEQEPIEQEPASKPVAEEPTEPAIEAEPQPVEDVAPASQAMQEPEESTTPPVTLEQKPNSRKKLWIGIAAAIALIAIVAATVSGLHSRKDDDKVAMVADSVKNTTPAPAIVTDTLSRDHRLRDMAKKHYGDQDFWIYIYLENAKKYPDYHHIPNGSVLTIPPASKYAINSDSKSSLRRAHDETGKLYMQYRDKKDSIEQATKSPIIENTEEEADTLEKDTKHKRHHRYHKSNRDHKRHR